MTLSVQLYDSINQSPIADSELVYDDDAAPTGRWDVSEPQVQRELMGPGTGELAVPLLHPRKDLLTYRRCVRVRQQDADDPEVWHLIKSFLIREIEDQMDGKPEERYRKVKGVGLLGRLKEMLRLPPNPIDELPLSFVRRHDWGARDTPTTTWTDTIYPQDRLDLLGEATNRPVGWPTPVSPLEALGVTWVHSVAEGEVHPAGIDYYHREFTLDEDTEVAVFVTAADQFAACLDDVEMLSEELNGPNSVWWWTWKFAGRLKAGTHTLRLKVEVVNSTGQGGMICVAFKTGPGGISEILFASGNGAPGDIDGGWKLLSNPATPPGQTAGMIMRLGIEEATARGCEVPTRDFSDTHDSNGDPWATTIPLIYRVPCTEWDVLEQMSAWIEYRCPEDGYQLQMVNIDTALGETRPVELTDVTYRSTKGEA